MLRTVRTSTGPIEYELIQTQRQSMEIRLAAEGGIRLFAPRRAPLKSADAFVADRAQWIADSRLALREHMERRRQDHPVGSGSTILYEGEPIELRISPAARNLIHFDGEQVRVSATNSCEQAVREQLRRWLIEQAREQVAARIAHFAPLVGRAPERIAIRDQKTRWGSCSSQQNLNFNWKLIMAPPEALDYVVVHELCHLYEFNHSPRFWSRVERHLPEYRAWKDWLKKNGKLLGL